MLCLRSMGFKLLHGWLCCGWSSIHLPLLLMTPPASWDCHNYVCYSILSSPQTWELSDMVMEADSRQKNSTEPKLLKECTHYHSFIVCLQRWSSIPVLKDRSKHILMISKLYITWFNLPVVVLEQPSWTGIVDLWSSFKPKDMEITDLASALETKECSCKRDCWSGY